jgi:hypothetical protein
MRIVLEDAQLDDSVKEPVKIGEPFWIELTVSPARSGVQSANGVTFTCVSAEYTIAVSSPVPTDIAEGKETYEEVPIDIPEGTTKHKAKVEVTLTSTSHLDAARVDIDVTAGSKKPLSVKVYK